MSITKKDIQYVAGLARVSVTDSEAESFAQDFQSILQYVDQLKQVSDAPDNARHEHIITKVMRDDMVTNQSGDYTQSILGNAPDTENNYVKVKKIL